MGNYFSNPSLQKTLTIKEIKAKLIVEGQIQAAHGVMSTALLAQINSPSGSLPKVSAQRERQGTTTEKGELLHLLKAWALSYEMSR